MIVLLDSNVIIAAVAAHGLCYEILIRIMEKDTLILSDQLLLEVESNLRKKLKVKKIRVTALFEELGSVGLRVVPAPVPTSACRDPNDLHILGAAVAGKAELIISGDQDLLVLRKFKNIPIETPREAWRRMND